MFSSRRISYLLVLTGAAFCYSSLGAVIRIVPPYVGGDLGGSAFAIGLAIGAPALTAVVARPLAGRLADERGTRLVAVGGAAVMSLGALPMYAHAFAMLIASRLLVGAGEGAMMSASVLALLRLAGPGRRGRALGHIGLANYAGLALGPLLADLLGGGSDPERVFLAATVLPLGCMATSFVQPGERLHRSAAGEREPLADAARLVLRPGIGLMLVNTGYVALLSFGAGAIGAAGVVALPTYAAVVIAVRTLAGGMPDRYGGRRTLTLAASAAAAGLLSATVLPGPAALAGVAVLGIGQALAVPALGLLALERVPARRHGAAGGVFFAWFDASVGLGGPLLGAAASLAGPTGALLAAAATTALAASAALQGSGPGQATHPRRVAAEDAGEHRPDPRPVAASE